MSVLDITNKKGQLAALPAFAPASLVDTHTHLGMQDDPPLRIARAATAGIGTLITICDPGERLEPYLDQPESEGGDNGGGGESGESGGSTENGESGESGQATRPDEVELTYGSLESWRSQAREILDGEGRGNLPTPELRILIGLHPHHARFWSADIEAQIRERAADPRTVGLGEMGLDYHYDYSPRDRQREVFAAELRLACELDLPVCLHLREAHDDGLRILREVGVPPRGAILHCFNLDYEVAAPFVELGCVVSFAGPLTFKKAEEVREAARRLPGGILMVETDAPFMAPEPLRGTVCEPAFTAFTAARLAELRGCSLDEIATQTTACARKVFGL